MALMLTRMSCHHMRNQRSRRLLDALDNLYNIEYDRISVYFTRFRRHPPPNGSASISIHSAVDDKTSSVRGGRNLFDR
jgi:hypothetical protein